jgi:hypothetical protein
LQYDRSTSGDTRGRWPERCSFGAWTGAKRGVSFDVRDTLPLILWAGGVATVFKTATKRCLRIAFVLIDETKSCDALAMTEHLRWGP